jgi:hypothetical protein
VVVLAVVVDVSLVVVSPLAGLLQARAAVQSHAKRKERSAERIAAWSTRTRGGASRPRLTSDGRATGFWSITDVTMEATTENTGTTSHTTHHRRRAHALHPDSSPQSVISTRPRACLRAYPGPPVA